MSSRLALAATAIIALPLTASSAVLASRNAALNTQLRSEGKPTVGLLDFDGEFMGQVLSYKRAAVVEKVKQVGKDVGTVAANATSALAGSK